MTINGTFFTLVWLSAILALGASFLRLITYGYCTLTHRHYGRKRGTRVTSEKARSDPDLRRQVNGNGLRRRKLGGVLGPFIR